MAADGGWGGVWDVFGAELGVDFFPKLIKTGKLEDETTRKLLMMVY